MCMYVNFGLFYSIRKFMSASLELNLKKKVTSIFFKRLNTEQASLSGNADKVNELPGNVNRN